MTSKNDVSENSYFLREFMEKHDISFSIDWVLNDISFGILLMDYDEKNYLWYGEETEFRNIKNLSKHVSVNITQTEFERLCNELNMSKESCNFKVIPIMTYHDYYKKITDPVTVQFVKGRCSYEAEYCDWHKYSHPVVRLLKDLNIYYVK